MARYPAAIWKGSPNETPKGMIAHVGLVLHIEQGTEAGTDSWFQNPSSQVSAHFSIAKTGEVHQYVDTDDKAWAEVAGNPNWVSVEFEGMSGESLTTQQIDSCGKLYAWLHGLYGMPFVSTDDPNGSGLGWHGMGGLAWGGHINCPGDPIKAQRGAILAAANPTPEVKPVLATRLPAISALPVAVSGYLLTSDGAVYAGNPAVYHGGCNGKPYFFGRTAQDLKVLADGTYIIIATSGEQYGPVF